MGRFSFALSLAVNAALLGLIATAVLATVLLEPSEEQLDWGLLWLLSLPAVIAFSLLAELAYSRYMVIGSRARVALYASLVVAIAGLAPLCTYVLLAVLDHAAA